MRRRPSINIKVSIDLRLQEDLKRDLQQASKGNRGHKTEVNNLHLDKPTKKNILHETKKNITTKVVETKNICLESQT